MHLLAAYKLVLKEKNNFLVQNCAFSGVHRPPEGQGEMALRGHNRGPGEGGGVLFPLG